MSLEMPEEVEAFLDASDAAAPWPGENRSAVYRHCFEVRRREMDGRPWRADEARARAALAYEADMRPVPEMPRGRPGERICAALSERRQERLAFHPAPSMS